jgi:hypothetical protein
VRRVRTLYAAVGDGPAVAAGLALVATALAAGRRMGRQIVARPIARAHTGWAAAA